jgi:hypothetical protein
MTARFIQFSNKCIGNFFRWLTLHPAVALALLVAVVLLPFLGKPFNMDDPLFLRAARHIQEHPLDLYGFAVNWFGTETPMWEATKNPPLACYYVASAAGLLAVGLLFAGAVLKEYGPIQGSSRALIGLQLTFGRVRPDRVLVCVVDPVTPPTRADSAIH